MLRQLSVLWLACGALTGCTMLDSLPVGPLGRASDSFDISVANQDLDLHSVEGRAKARRVHRELNRSVMRQMLTGTPQGSQVSLVDEDDRRYIGTLLSENPDRVELMNCLCREVVPAPGDRWQCKTSHVPFLTLRTSSLTHFNVLAPPDRDFKPADMGEDRDAYSVAEIVYRNGRRQRWSTPLDDDQTGHATITADP